MITLFAQAIQHIDETATLIQSHGWGLAAIAIIVTLMLTLFAINMVDARKREQRYVEENREREDEMQTRLDKMETRQFSEIAGMAKGYNQAIVEQTAVCRELAVIMKDTTHELALALQSREQVIKGCPGPAIHKPA